MILFDRIPSYSKEESRSGNS